MGVIPTHSYREGVVDWWERNSIVFLFVWGVAFDLDQQKGWAFFSLNSGDDLSTPNRMFWCQKLLRYSGWLFGTRKQAHEQMTGVQAPASLTLSLYHVCMPHMHRTYRS